MATFEVPVLAIAEIKPHPDATVHSLEIAIVAGYEAIVAKSKYKPGDLIAYIPEGAIVPEELLKSIGLSGKLGGRQKNRVKAIKLRGQLSQGLVIDLPQSDQSFTEGQNLAEFLGITKYEPEIPVELKGQVYGSSYRVNFDVENYKRWSRNNVFTDGEIVVFTEKIHGSCHIAAIVPPEHRQDDMHKGKFFISSKGLARNGFMQKVTEENKTNLYVQAFEKYNLEQKLEAIANHFGSQDVLLVGEIFGPIQDMKYDSSRELRYAAFGLRIDGVWQDFFILSHICDTFGIPSVPIVYHGPFSHEKVLEFTDGKEQITGKEVHIREGIVIYPNFEREHPKLGRVFLKSVSEAYLLRKDGSEYN